MSHPGASYYTATTLVFCYAPTSSVCPLGLPVNHCPPGGPPSFLSLAPPCLFLDYSLSLRPVPETRHRGHCALSAPPAPSAAAAPFIFAAPHPLRSPCARTPRARGPSGPTALTVLPPLLLFTAPPFAPPPCFCLFSCCFPAAPTPSPFAWSQMAREIAGGHPPRVSP